MLHKNSDRKGSVVKEKISGQGAWRQDKHIGGKYGSVNV
jgi:hypothetical protein